MEDCGRVAREEVSHPMESSAILIPDKFSGNCSPAVVFSHVYNK